MQHGPASSILTLDGALEQHIGQFGHGQVLPLVLISLSYIPMGVVFLLMVFTSLDPVTAGLWECTDPTDTACTDLRVHTRDLTSLSRSWCDLAPGSTSWTRPGYSIISTWDLVCGQGWKVTFINSIYFVGLAVGGILFGSLCDRHGRKAALYSATVLAAVSTLLGLLAPTYWVHFVFRILSAVGVQGMAIADIVLVTEPVGPAFRGRAGIITQAFFILGEWLLALLAWLLPEWRHLSLAAAVLCAAFLLTWPLVDESPRWLLHKGERAASVRVLQRVATRNGRNVDPWVWDALLTPASHPRSAPEHHGLNSARQSLDDAGGFHSFSATQRAERMRMTKSLGRLPWGDVSCDSPTHLEPPSAAEPEATEPAAASCSGDQPALKSMKHVTFGNTHTSSISGADGDKAGEASATALINGPAPKAGVLAHSQSGSLLRPAPSDACLLKDGSTDTSEPPAPLGQKVVHIAAACGSHHLQVGAESVRSSSETARDCGISRTGTTARSSLETQSEAAVGHDHDYDDEQVGLLGHCHAAGTHKMYINTNSSRAAQDLGSKQAQPSGELSESERLQQGTGEDSPRGTRDGEDGHQQLQEQQQQGPTHLGPLDALARSSTLRRYTAVLSFCLMSLVLTYSGANFAAGVLGGNTYVDFFLLALAELPSAAVEASLIDSLGRVALMGGGLVLSTLVCLAGALLTRWSGIQVAAAMAAKFGSNVAWSTLVVYATEVLPTPVRSTLSGIINQLGRVGGIAAPYLFYAAGLSGSKGLPFLVMAAWSCAATGLIIWLPETAGTHVPDTLSDLDRLARSGGAAQHLRAVLRRWREGRRPLLAESRQQQQAGAGVREGGVVPS